MAKLGHPDGELNLVRAASTGGIMHGISINASCSLEEMDVVYKPGDPRIFQIYLDRNRKVRLFVLLTCCSVRAPADASVPRARPQNSEALVKKIEKMGFDAIMFTVGQCFHLRAWSTRPSGC